MDTRARIRDLAANRGGNAPQNRILDMNRGGHTAAPSFSGADAASRCIVGYHLHPNLEKEGPLKALEKAFNFYKTNGIDISKLIHHSDRGSQYASSGYVARLQAEGCQISMTQTGDPLHNALAERMNGIIKNSWMLSDEKRSFARAEALVEQAVCMYDEARPHQSLGYKTPMQAVKSDSPNPLVQQAPKLPLPALSLLKKLRLSRRRTFAH